MSITFKHTIVHILDLSLNMPVLSTKLLILDDETEAYITKHIVKLFDNPASAKACFEESSPFLPFFSSNMTEESFYELSTTIAEKYFQYMEEYGNISAGDLLISHFLLNEEPFITVLKLNYKEAFTHHVETNEQGTLAKIIKHKGIFPSGSKQVEEGIIVNLSTLNLTILDQSKSDYLSLLFGCSPHLSVKETIQLVEKVASEIIDTHYENKIEALSELKNNISDSLAKTQTIPIQEVIHKTFGEDEEVYLNCMEKFEEIGLSEATIEISDTKLTNKFTSHRLKTDTGIELKFPTPIFKNPDYIEFINNPDGTLSIVLKNISQITNK